MMRKNSASMGGGVPRPGTLKPRNTERTPNNRSAGQQIRKSYLQKSKEPDSAKRGVTRKRTSAEGMTRLSLASGRFTPTRNNALSTANLAPPPSVSRLSMDSARNSSMGGKGGRKETRPITDPAFKSQCIDKVLDFLVSMGYDYQVQRRTLLTPTSKDFASIFNFIYRHLDGQYNLPNKFEEEVPRLLKQLKYPVQMSRSSFITVGSPHTWPTVLAMLAWFVDLVSIYANINPGYISFPSDFESDVNTGKLRFETLVTLCSVEDQQHKVEEHLEEYRHTLEKSQGVRPQDMLQSEEEELQLEEMMNNLKSGPERLEQLHHQCTQLMDDGEKMAAYCRELQVHISAKDGEKAQMESKLAELDGKKMQVMEEVTRLEKLKEHQALTIGELSKFKNHASDIATCISQLQTQGKELDSQIWSTEMELGKAQTAMNEKVCIYNKFCGQLELSQELKISSLDIAESLHHWRVYVLDDLRTLKKEAKFSTYDAQTKMMRKEEEIEKVREKLLDEKQQMMKRETKLRRLEEDVEITKNENTREEQEMQQEIDRLHQQIVDARKTHKGSLYQMQCGRDQAMEQLKNVKASGRERIKAGIEFLVRVSHACLEHLEWEQQETLKNKMLNDEAIKKLMDACAE